MDIWVVSTESIISNALRTFVCTSFLWTCFFFYKFIFIIYSWLHWVFVAARAFSNCGEWGLLFVAVRRLLIVVASLGAEHGLYVHRLQQLWCTGFSGMWDPPGPGIEPVSTALAGGFLTTAPPGKSLWTGFYFSSIYLRVKLLAHMVTLCLIFWKIAKLFPKVAMPFYILTSSDWGSHSLYIITNTCYYLSFWL